MKYVVLLCDGMADYKLQQLDDKTPMMVAKKPTMDKLAKNGLVGLVKTVGAGLKPGSDVANLSVMGYDPYKYYSGRSPLEAASIGIDMSENDIAMRCNLVALSDDECFEDKTMDDYCADDIGTKEADQIIKTLASKLNTEEMQFFTGVSYRHCLVLRNKQNDLGDLTPPHDISGRRIGEYLPTSDTNKFLLDLTKKCHEILKDHPVNLDRIKRGKKPANSIWLWGNGTKKALPSFKEKFGLNGSVISAVDLIKGIGKLTEMNVIEVDGATGYIDTNFEGKTKAAIKTLRDGNDFVYLHVEAPDECGHRFEVENKVKSLEIIDEVILAPLVAELENYDDYKIMILPDHATPLELKTHASDPVPFLIYHKCGTTKSGVESFNEDTAKQTGVFVEVGSDIMSKFINE